MKQEDNDLILAELRNHKIIPLSGSFELNDTIIEAYNTLYKQLFNKTGSYKPRKNEVRYFRKLAALNLLKASLAASKEKQQVVSRTILDKPKSGIIYLISNPAFPGCYKIGLTQNLDKRLASYQTYDPYRSYKVEHYKFVNDARQIEKDILIKYNVNIISGEWVKGEAIKAIFL